MGWGPVLVLLAFSLSLQPRAAAGDWLSPTVSPILKGLCDVVECGKGSCRADGSRYFGYVCECHPGWTKVPGGDHFQFLPCVIPNCTLNYSCYNATAKAPSPSLQVPPPSSDHSLYNPCTWSYCGGGTCVKTSDYGHRCDCDLGYVNLLNATHYPCIKDCVLGADCARLGIDLPRNGSSSSQPNQLERAANKASSRSPWSLMWISLLMLSLAMAPTT